MPDRAAPIAELATNPAPVTLEEVLSPAWLTGMLSSRFPGVVVESTTITERLQTVATKVRFDLTYNGDAKGAPTAMCVKGYFSPESLGRGSGNAVEPRFYREIAPALPINLPPCVYAGVDTSTGQALIIMDDLVAAGWHFLTALSPYTVDQTARTLDQLALLHASCWENNEILSSTLLQGRLDSILSYVPRDRLIDHMADSRGAHLPADVKDVDRLRASVPAVLGMAKSGLPLTMVHGDAHAGNIYENDAGEPGIIDWQVVQRGSWALDVAYHLPAVLTPDEREKSEQELLRHYLGRLAHHGGKPPAFDDAWHLYRAHLPYGYFMWAITRMVDRPIIDQFTMRCGLAVAQHGSFELLGV